MAHFAQIDAQGVVTQVIVVSNSRLLDENGQESEALGKQFCRDFLGGDWAQTSYNGRFRKRFASIGGTYDAAHDVFIAEKPFPSWVLDENFDWTAPTPMPNDGQFYVWNEDNQQWAVMPDQE